jgi:hypothetical protein
VGSFLIGDPEEKNEPGFPSGGAGGVRVYMEFLQADARYIAAHKQQ